jgi:hypothetical protein
MNAKLLIVILIVAAGSAFGLSSSSGISVDCDSLAVNIPATHNQRIPLKNRFISTLLIKVHTTNLGSDGKIASKCRITWSVFSVAKDNQLTRLLQYSEVTEESEIGAEFLGTSRDGSKLLVNFWTAAGDYTGHRPAVYDVAGQQGYVRPVADRVIKNLPSCDYFTEIVGVTDEGNVILHVPTSIYVDQGCPDQGKWLLNMKTNRITRLKSHHDVSKKTDH